MNGNLDGKCGRGLDAMMKGLVWAPLTLPDMVCAAFTDSGDIDDEHMLAQLSSVEHDKASELQDPVERRHFIVRRCFQRVFVSTFIKWQGALPDLHLTHQLDSRPTCADAPDVCLSFSSSGTTALACASCERTVGIDVEKHRKIENAEGLAHRFFAGPEAASISALTGIEQNLRFLQYWTAKEAGLKALGRGIVSGLNSFTLSYKAGAYEVVSVSENHAEVEWRLEFPELVPGHIVALMHRPR